MLGGGRRPTAARGLTHVIGGPIDAVDVAVTVGPNISSAFGTNRVPDLAECRSWRSNVYTAEHVLPDALHARLYVASGRASDGLKLSKVDIGEVANTHRDDGGVMGCQQRRRC